MQVCNPEDRLLVFHRDDSELARRLIPGYREVYESEHIRVFLVPAKVSEVHKVFGKNSDFTSDRYLDRFYICCIAREVKKHQETLDGFFDFVSSDYENIIDTKRNLSNVRNLVRILEENLELRDEGKIIDFGCGTGISMSQVADCSFEVIGVDRCPNMRKLASQKRMKVWDMGELARQQRYTIDGSFASYVLHLLQDTAGIKLLWSLLKPGGILVGNFHKNHGIDILDGCMKELRGEVVLRDNNILHGTYIAYRKKG